MSKAVAPTAGTPAAPVPVRSRLSIRLRAGWHRLYRFYFGEDFFVTYARADAAAYAAALGNRLLDQGYTCFVDQWHPVVDAEIPPAIRRALLHASTQVIVATPAAALSGPVAQEVALFALTRRPVVPIDVDQALAAAPWARFTTGIARSVESLRAVTDGEPSPAVVRRLVETFRYRRRSWRIRASLGLFALVSVGLGASSLQQAAVAERQARAAEARGRLADSRALAITSRTLPLAVDQKLLLAVQAWRLDRNGDARDALSNAVQEAGSLERTLYSPDPERTRAVAGVGLSADGSLALAGYADGSLAAWQLDAGARAVRWVPASSERRRGTRAALSPDARWAAIGHADGGVDIVAWQAGGFGPVRTLVERTPQPDPLPVMVSALTFSAGGRHLAVGWSDGRVQFFDPGTGAGSPIVGEPFDARREHHRLGVLALAFDPDGGVLASSHGVGRILLWKAGQQPRPAREPLAVAADASGVVFDSSGRHLLLALGREGRPQRLVWDGTDAAPVDWPAAAEPMGAWTQLARLAGGQDVVLQPLTSALRSAPIDGPGPVRTRGPRPQHDAGVIAAAVHRQRIAVGLPDGTVQIHRLDVEAALRRPPPVPGLRRLAFDATGERLYAVGDAAFAWQIERGTAFVRAGAGWDARRGQVLNVDPDGDGIALVLADRQQWRCDERGCAGEASASASASAASVESVWQDSESGGAWTVQAGSKTGSKTGSTTKVCSAARCEEASAEAAGGGRRFAVSSKPGLWAYASERDAYLCHAGRCRPVPGLEPGSDGWISGLAFAPSGDELVVATSEGRVRFIAAPGGSELTPARMAHAGAITRIAFDRTSRLMATGGRGGTIQLWDLSNRRPIGAPTARPGNEQVVDLALSSNGAQLAALYSDGSVESRLLDPETLAQRACAVANRTLALDEWRLLGGSDESCPAVCAPPGTKCLAPSVRATVHR